MSGAGSSELYVSSAGYVDHSPSPDVEATLHRWWHVTPADLWLLLPAETTSVEALVEAHIRLHR